MLVASRRLKVSNDVVTQLDDEPAAIDLLNAHATKKQRGAIISSLKQYLEAAWQAMPPPFLQVCKAAGATRIMMHHCSAT